MKALKILVIATLFVSLTPIVWANSLESSITESGKPGVGLVTIQSGDDFQGFVLAVNPASARKTLVRFIDTDKNELYKEYLNSTGTFQKKFNLKNLESGSYLLIVESEEEYLEQTVVVESGQITIDETRQVRVQRPTLEVEEDQMRLTVDAAGHPKMNIHFGNESQDVFFSERVSASGLTRRAYNLRELDPGNYYVIVSYKGVFFKEPFTLK